MVALAGKTDFAADPTCCAVVPRDKNEEASRKGTAHPKALLSSTSNGVVVEGDELQKNNRSSQSVFIELEVVSGLAQ